MLSCVSKWSSRVSVHSSHSGWSTSVWPDMMSNRSLVTWVGKIQIQNSYFQTITISWPKQAAVSTVFTCLPFQNTMIRVNHHNRSYHFQLSESRLYLQSATKVFHRASIRCFSNQCEAVGTLCGHHPVQKSLNFSQLCQIWYICKSSQILFICLMWFGWLIN